MEDLYRFIGVWISDPSDIDAITRYGEMTLEFTRTGKLIYTMDRGTIFKSFQHSFYIEDGILVVPQESGDPDERTPYYFTEQGDLVLDYSGRRLRYLRKYL